MWEFYAHFCQSEKLFISKILGEKEYYIIEKGLDPDPE